MIEYRIVHNADVDRWRIQRRRFYGWSYRLWEYGYSGTYSSRQEAEAKIRDLETQDKYHAALFNEDNWKPV